MKRILLVSLEVAFCFTLVQAKEPSDPADFSGSWVLDFRQTKDLPAGLQGYSMIINEDGQELKVETSLEGDPQPNPTMTNPDSYPGGSPGGYPGGRGSGSEISPVRKQMIVGMPEDNGEITFSK